MTHWDGHNSAAAQAAQVLDDARLALPSSPAFHAMAAPAQADLKSKLDRVRRALKAQPLSLAQSDPYDANVLAQPMAGRFGGYSPTESDASAEESPTEAPKPVLRASNELPTATGAMMEELGFSDFVASLVHGTFDAIVDSSIRQMEAFAELVSSLSQTVEDFSNSNVSNNQVRDWLVERHPGDLQLLLPTAAGQQPQVIARRDKDDWGHSPDWLADYDLAGEELTDDLIETQILPKARMQLGQDRMRNLAALTLMGMNRVKVERGEINAKVRIRAKASDSARVGFAQDHDGAGGGSGWSGRAGFSAPAAQAMVSTTVNAQSDGAIAAELQGEVRIVFASDTVPLESFVSDAQRVLLQRTAQTPTAAPARQVPQTIDVAPTPAPTVPAPEGEVS